MKYYSAVKKRGLTVFYDLEGIVLSGISQPDKDEYHTISLICRIEKAKSNKQTESRNGPINTESKLVVARGLGSGDGQNGGRGVAGTTF